MNTTKSTRAKILITVGALLLVAITTLLIITNLTHTPTATPRTETTSTQQATQKPFTPLTDEGITAEVQKQLNEYIDGCVAANEQFAQTKEVLCLTEWEIPTFVDLTKVHTLNLDIIEYPQVAVDTNTGTFTTVTHGSVNATVTGEPTEEGQPTEYVYFTDPNNAVWGYSGTYTIDERTVTVNVSSEMPTK